MTDVIYFEKDGFTYAKGFFNQNGLSFYVLAGHKDIFDRKIPILLRKEQGYYIEEVSKLPGETRLSD